MSDRLELVTQFDDLAAGMSIVVVPCNGLHTGRACGAAHRAMLMPYRDMLGNVTGWAFLMEPPPSCTAPRACGISKVSVATGTLYRIVDDADDSRSTEAERPRKLVQS